MICNLAGSCILSLAAGVAIAQGTASSSGAGVQYTKAEIKQMTATAHTADQYKTLASYYGAKRDSYLQQAAKAKMDWEAKSKNVTGRIGKYPRPMDSARNLYEYYMSKASGAEALVAKFSQSADSGTPENAE
jgi:hypothetical protein